MLRGRDVCDEYSAVGFFRGPFVEDSASVVLFVGEEGRYCLRRESLYLAGRRPCKLLPTSRPKVSERLEMISPC